MKFSFRGLHPVVGSRRSSNICIVNRPISDWMEIAGLSPKQVQPNNQTKQDIHVITRLNIKNVCFNWCMTFLGRL